MSRAHEIGVGCLVVVATGLLAFMAWEIGAIRTGGSTITVTATMKDVAGLSEGAVVAVSGVQVGRVEGLAVDFDHAVATLSLDESAHVRADASVAMRARSVLGEKYLELIPHSPDAPLLVEGGTLTDAVGAVEIDQLVNRMAPLLDALDPAALKALGDALKADPERAARMLADAERLLHNAAVASDELPALAKEGHSTLASVTAAADNAGPVLDHVDGTLSKADGAIERADAALDRADALIASVPPERVTALLNEIEGGVADGRVIIKEGEATAKDAHHFMNGWKDVDWREFRRLAQEQGVFIRLTPYPVDSEKEK